MSQAFAFDVFISYNARDKPRVRPLAERLSQAGLRVWFDEWNIHSGDIIALKVDEGLEQSRVLVLCLSPQALNSEWVALERSTAIHRDPSNEGRRFIPMLLSDCDLPDAMRRYKYVDYREENEEGFKEVLRACQPDSTGPDRDKLVVKSNYLSSSRLVTGKITQKGKLIWNEEIKEEWSSKGIGAAFLSRKLAGHTNAVCSVAVSPDGTWAVSGSRDKTVRIWDLNTGKCLAILKGHLNQVNSVAISPNKKWIFSGSSDKAIYIWDVAVGKKIRENRRHRDPVSVVLALPRGRILFVTGGIRPVVCMEPAFGGERISLAMQNARSICASRDGRRVAICGREGMVRIWNVNTSGPTVDLHGHKRSEVVGSIDITRDGRYAVSGSGDQTIKVWDLDAEICVITLEGHHGSVSSVAISPDGNLIASAGFTEGEVRLWDWRMGTCLQVFKLKNPPISLAFSPEGSHLLVGTTTNILVFTLVKDRFATENQLTRRYVNAKVVLLGEGTVGKTSLAHRLIDDEYVVRDRTHGLNVWRLDLPLTADTTLEREALLWDLAGQEDYRLIHTLFLQETALALLLVNPQSTDPFRETGDWLKMLKAAANDQDPGREPNRLLILSQVDVGGPKLSDTKISQFCKENNFNAWMTTSSKTGENCSDKQNGGHPSPLKALIATSIPWENLPWTSTPRLLAALKNAVVALRDERDIRLLRFSELTQRLELLLPAESFGEADVRTAVTLLANHGIVRPLKFGDLVLLQPELLNGYAAAIIRAARAHSDEIGCVLEAAIYDPVFDFTGVERLSHRPDEELLVRALVQTFLDHSLCIAEDTPGGRQLVFPSQYRREKESPHDPPIFVSYTFSGEWQTVWTTLVVRLWYSTEFQQREIWRNAAEFASPKGYNLGLKISNQQGEGRATISFYFAREVSDELKSLFIDYGHRHLARYAVEVRRDRRYVCADCGKPVNDLEAVRLRLESKKDFITCQGCDAHVPLLDFIEKRIGSDPIARQILAMDEKATRELDSQALEQILIGHMMAIAGEANQIFRPIAMLEYGIDGEVEFKDDDGKASSKRIYIQLKSVNSFLRIRNCDGREIFTIKNESHLAYWLNQSVDVYLVIRQTEELSGESVIRWMNITEYIKSPNYKQSRQIIFSGELLDMSAVWKVRDRFFPAKSVVQR